MILVVCAVRDSAVGAFMQPFFCPSVGVAMRSFADEVNKDGSPIKAHPADYEMWCLGEFDDVEGVFNSEKRSLARAGDLLRKE